MKVYKQSQTYDLGDDVWYNEQGYKVTEIDDEGHVTKLVSPHKLDDAGTHCDVCTAEYAEVEEYNHDDPYDSGIEHEWRDGFQERHEVQL